MPPNAIIPFPLPRRRGEGTKTSQRLAHGRITGRDQEAYVTRLEDGRTVLAYRASGCLLVPEAGDVVLVYAGPGKAVYVLNVLEKASPDSTLAFEESVRIRAGRVEVEGSQSVALRAPEVILRKDGSPVTSRRRNTLYRRRRPPQKSPGSASRTQWTRRKLRGCQKSR
jgi:hypothetical protein